MMELPDADLREQNPRAFLERKLEEMMETTRWEFKPEARRQFMDALDLYIAVRAGQCVPR